MSYEFVTAIVLIIIQGPAARDDYIVGRYRPLYDVRVC